MKNLVDLHTHSTKSDGTYSPNQLLQEAESKGIEIFSITDHETVEAYYDIDKKIFRGILIPGIELRTSCFGIAIELLGYGFDVGVMKKLLKQYHYKSNAELDKYMIFLANKQYKEIGVTLSPSFIEDFNPDIHPRLSKYIHSSIMKYPENKKYLESLPEGKSFFRYCMTNPDSPLFLDLSSAFPSIKELITTIKFAGGLVSIPHIFEYKDNSEKILQHLLENYEIDMIECYYSSFTQEQTDYLLGICKEYNKYVSGGSDFHGAIRPQVELGLGTNCNLQIPIETIKEWVHEKYL